MATNILSALAPALAKLHVQSARCGAPVCHLPACLPTCLLRLSCGCSCCKGASLSADAASQLAST